PGCAALLFGQMGFRGPAVEFGRSTNFALANFSASRSFGNVSVALASARFPGGSSNETYHVPWDLLAMGSKPWSSAFNRHRPHKPSLAGALESAARVNVLRRRREKIHHSKAAAVRCL